MVEENRDRLIRSMTEAGGRLRVRNALYPVLWLCGVVAVPCIVALSWIKEPPPVLSVILCLVVGTTLFSYLYLLVRDPDRLHSEEYLIRSRTLDIIEEKGSRKAIDAALMRTISQTDFLAPPEVEGDDQR